MLYFELRVSYQCNRYSFLLLGTEAKTEITLAVKLTRAPSGTKCVLFQGKDSHKKTHDRSVVDQFVDKEKVHF